MTRFFSLIIILIVLLMLASAKVLLRTNPGLGLTVIAGGALLLALCWYLYPKITRHFKKDATEAQSKLF